MPDWKRSLRQRPRGRRSDVSIRDRAGQALAEMVMVIPVLVILVFGIIEFGLAFRTYQIITNSAREGARVAVLPSTTTLGADGGSDHVDTVVRNRMSDAGLNDANADVQFRCNAGGEHICTTTGGETEIRVHYCHRFFVLGPLVSLAGGGGDCDAFGEVEIRTGSTMRAE